MTTNLKVGDHVGARRWESEGQAKAAWEKAMKDPTGCSIWRTAAPRRPPHRHHIVIVMGEDKTLVERRLAVIAEYGGEEWPLDPELIESLRMRRLRTALDSGGERFQTRNMNATLDKKGRLWRR
jgi:hypothetical protein